MDAPALPARRHARGVCTRGNAPTGPRRSGTGRGTSLVRSRPTRSFSAGARSAPIGSSAPHASKAACPSNCEARSTATGRRCTNASECGTATCSTATAWCRRSGSTARDSPTAPECSPLRSWCVRPKPGGGSSRDSRPKWTAGCACAAPMTSTSPTSRCWTITASCSRCGKGARRAWSTATRSSGGASRSGASPSRAYPSPRTPRWNPTEPSGQSGSASRRAGCSCSITSTPTAAWSRRRPSTPARSAWCTTSWSPPGTWSSSFPHSSSSASRAGGVPARRVRLAPESSARGCWWSTRTTSTSAALVPAPGRLRLPSRQRVGRRDRGTIRYDHCVAADATLMTDTMRDLMRGAAHPLGAPEHYSPVHTAP